MLSASLIPGAKNFFCPTTIFTKFTLVYSSKKNDVARHISPLQGDDLIRVRPNFHAAEFCRPITLSDRPIGLSNFRMAATFVSDYLIQ